MGSTIKRIVYCEPSHLSSIPGDEIDVYDPQMAVRAVNDDVLLEIEEGFSFLYFSRSDFDGAIRELSVEQIREVIFRRRESWSPEAANHSIRWLIGELRKCLSLTAAAFKEREQPVENGPLQDNFEHNIGRISLFSGGSPLGLLTLPEVLIVALEGAARIRVECENLGIENGEELATIQSQHEAVIAQMLVKLGHEVFAQGPMNVTCKRAVNVLPLGESIRLDMAANYEAPIDWTGGAVIPWPHENIDELEQEGVSVHVLYPNADEFADFASTATPGQIERDLNERLAAASEPDDIGFGNLAIDHINGLLLEQIVYLRGLYEELVQSESADQTDLAREIEPLIREDMLALKESLGIRPSWLSSASVTGSKTMDRILAMERQVQQSIELFAQCSCDSVWVDLHPDYEALQERGSRLI